MKTINVCLFVTLFFSTSLFASAFGTFELLDSKALPNAVAGQFYSRNISFVYSGDWFPSANIIGVNLPEGMKVGSVYKKSTGFYYVTYSGTPKYAGRHSFKLFLTDDNGGSVIENLTFEVVHTDIVTITEIFLPTAHKDKDYKGYIKFKYFGAKPSLSFVGNYPQGISSEISYGYPDTSLVNPISSGLIEIKGVIKKAENYNFNLAVGSGDFNSSVPLEIKVINETIFVPASEPTVPAPVVEIAKVKDSIKKVSQSSIKKADKVLEEETIRTVSSSTLDAGNNQTLELKNETQIKEEKKSLYQRVKNKVKDSLISFINRL